MHPQIGKYALATAVITMLTPVMHTPGQTWREPTPSEAVVTLDKPAVAQTESFQPDRLGIVSRYTALTGKPVRNADGLKVGRMDDLIVNLATGKIVGCMVGRGENEVVVVPPDRFFPASEDRIVFTGQSKDLKSARPLPRGSSQTSFNTATISEAFRHFGANAPTLPQDAVLATASSLLTKTVLSRDNKPLGQVKNLVADVSRGQAVYVVIQPPDRSDDLFVVPPAAFDTKDQGSTLLLKEDQQAFLAGPKVPQRFWTEMTMPEFARQVYGYYNLGGEDTTVASTPAGTAGGEPIPTPTGRSDAEIRSALLGEIVNSAAMPAMNAKKLRIQVNDGVVTLSGTVPSERAHEALLSAAKKVAGENRVRDQLRLR